MVITDSVPHVFARQMLEEKYKKFFCGMRANIALIT